jgi:hypothetical protein
MKGVSAMRSVKEIEARRQAIVDEMCSIRSMVRGTISEQYLKVRLVGSKEPVERGPYFVLSRSENKKTVSRRLSGRELEQARRDVAEHGRFVALCKEFEGLTEQLGELERGSNRFELEKKRRRSSLSKAKR